MIRNQAVLVISGYNIRAVIAFCRWATAHHVHFHIVAASDSDPIVVTDYRDRVAFTRDSPRLTTDHCRSWVEALRDQYGYDRVLILPSSEYLNRFLLDYRDVIEAEDCVIPLVDARLYTRISDKQSFTRLCGEYGLDIPGELTNVPERFPFVAKPRAYLSATGRQLVPHIVDNQHDLEQFRKAEDSRDYFFQQFICGASHYLLAYIGQNGTDVLFSQQNLMQQARGGSIILARASDFHQTEVAQRYVEMLHDLSFYGLIMVEVRRDASDGRYFMIEANPRLWGPLQFAIDNDVDLFGSMLRNHDFEISRPNATPRLATHYFWSGGITQNSQPIALHDYSGDQFVTELPRIRPQDIFLRQDTLSLFLQESQMEDVRES